MYYKNLKAAVIRGVHDVLVELDLLWTRMGLQEFEIEERTTTVEKKIRRISHEMVEHEENNIKDILSQCESYIDEEKRLWSKLSTLEPEPSPISDDVSLMEKLRIHKSRLTKLQNKEEKIMVKHRSCYVLMEELAKKLGEKVMDIDVEEIPNADTISRLDEYIEELKLIKESRENEVISFKDQIVNLTDILDYDSNTTALSITF